MAQALLARDIFMADVKKVPPENFLRQHFFAILCNSYKFSQPMIALASKGLRTPVPKPSA